MMATLKFLGDDMVMMLAGEQFQVCSCLGPLGSWKLFFLLFFSLSHPWASSSPLPAILGWGWGMGLGFKEDKPWPVARIEELFPGNSGVLMSLLAARAIIDSNELYLWDCAKRLGPVTRDFFE